MSKFLSKFISLGIRALLLFFTEHRKDRVLIRLSAMLSPVKQINTVLGGLKFSCPSILSLFYPRHLFARESEGLSWVNGFEKGDVFWDIGANVGSFSLYAGLRSDLRILAFEPGSSSYATLNKNVQLNGMQDRIEAYCLAFSDKTELQYLHMSETDAGSVRHVFGDAREGFGYEGDYTFRQGMLGFSIDDFIAFFSPPFPNHIKIDVDNIENLILSGGQKALGDSRLKSIYIEMRHSERGKHTLNLLHDAGFQEVDGANIPGTPGAPKICSVLFVRKS